MGERRVDVVGALEVLADPPERMGVLVRPTAPTTSRMAHARGLMGGSRIAPQRSMHPFLTVMAEMSSRKPETAPRGRPRATVGRTGVRRDSWPLPTHSRARGVPQLHRCGHQVLDLLGDIVSCAANAGASEAVARPGEAPTHPEVAINCYRWELVAINGRGA